MKKLVSILIAIIVTIAISSCSNKEKPEQVVKNFFEYVSKAEFDKAKDLCTGKVKQTLEEMEKTIKESPDKKSELSIEIKDIQCKIDDKGSKAICTFKAKAKDDSDFNEGKAELTKEDGKWKIEDID
ncbi:MAG: DUF4878 domain-containing protein [Bacteroidales bacterium]|nr:DUF4878 domain-containing protein [Bacteroidales bacterium]